MPAERLLLGIAAGRTNTDAVLVDDGVLVAKVKVPTTSDEDADVDEAIARVLQASSVDVALVRVAVLGASRATSAIETKSGLRRVAVLRIGALTSALPPLVAWPTELRDAVHETSAIVTGGFEFDGERIAPLDEAAIRAFAAGAAGGAQAVAITSVFSQVNAADELRAAEIIHQEVGDIPISMSHEIGSMGLLERENATILNAALFGVAAQGAKSFSDAVSQHGLDAECYFTQNDGTLMGLEYSMRFPVYTIGSGPANAMRGGAHSAGVTDAIVADIGGAATTVGRLAHGFPWESMPPNSVGGVDTNFRLPEVLTLPIGGSTPVPREASKSLLDPRRSGDEAISSPLCLGGSRSTLTDAAVASGRAKIGSLGVPAKWTAKLEKWLAESDRLLESVIDHVRLGVDDLPLVVVGGGAPIAAGQFSGVREVIRPLHYEVAGAIGAAIAPVSGYAERICPSRPDRLAAAVDEASADATARAIQAGADPLSVGVVEVDEVPLTYLRDPAVRIKVRAVGPPTSYRQRTARTLRLDPRTNLMRSYL